jgi:hypothetical protein
MHRSMARRPGCAEPARIRLGHPIVGNNGYEHSNARSGNRVEATHRGPGRRAEPDLSFTRYATTTSSQVQ